MTLDQIEARADESCAMAAFAGEHGYAWAETPLGRLRAQLTAGRTEPTRYTLNNVSIARDRAAKLLAA